MLALALVLASSSALASSVNSPPEHMLSHTKLILSMNMPAYTVMMHIKYKFILTYSFYMAVIFMFFILMPVVH